MSQLYFLRREIKLERERLRELLQASADNETARDMIAVSRRIVEKRVELSELEYARLTGMIDAVPDACLRCILRGRYIHCKSWAEIAMDVGGGNTPDSVRKAHDRYISREDAKTKK